MVWACIEKKRRICVGKILKIVMGMEVPGKRRRGRPKWEWLDSFRNDLWERELSREDAQDQPICRRFTRHIDPT